jgi:hypothetical protein
LKTGRDGGRIIVRRLKSWNGRFCVIGGVAVTRQHGLLNLAHIRKELPPLLDLNEDSESFEKLQRLIATVDRRINSRQEN